MTNREVAQTVLGHVGGKDNVVSNLTCMTHLRLDVFVSVDVLEKLTQYFMPVVNASTYTKKEYDLLTQYISSEYIIACHNYYPKCYTGLSYDRLCQINHTLKHLGVKIATFYRRRIINVVNCMRGYRLLKNIAIK